MRDTVQNVNEVRAAGALGCIVALVHNAKLHVAGAGTPAALGDSGLQSETLESLAGAVNYNSWLTSLAAPLLGDWPIELGSGHGDHAQAWLDCGVPRISVSEVDPRRLAHLRSRFAAEPRVAVTSFDVRAAPEGDHSAYVAFNVLEHIPDDVGALRAAHRLLRPGGLVIVLVPAFEFAMSRFDRQVGHIRRYTVPSLRSALSAADLEVERVHYVNLLGLPAWFVGMRVLGLAPREGPMLAGWDRAVVPLARRWETGHRPPFGQSVFAVGRVPAAP